MQKIKLCGNCFLILVLCILAGGMIIAAANYIPVNEKIKSASLEQIGSEGLFPEVPSMEGGYGNFHSMKPTALELATDSLMLKMALYEGEGEGIVQAFRCYSTQYEDEYSRYWHGYVAVLRVLLLAFDYYEIRILNGICQVLLFGMAAFFVWKQKGRRYTAALISSYLLLMPAALAQCLQYSWVFYVTFGALLVFLRWREFWTKGYRYIYFFVLTGAFAIYLDLLTFPLLTWGIPAVWWLVTEGEKDGDRKKAAAGYLGKTVASGLAWIAGYGGMWIGKWMLGSLVLGENLFRRAVSEALLWTVNEGDGALTLSDRLYAVFQNWCTYEYKFYIIILVGWLLYWCIKAAVCGCRRNPKAPALFLILCSSVVWYLFLAGHAQMHHIFTHRIFGVSIAAFFAMVLLGTERESGGGAGKACRAGCWAVLAGTALLGYGLMLLLKDVYGEHNGTCSFERIELEGAVAMDFIPEYQNVAYVNVGIMTEPDSVGLCRILLLDRDTVLEEKMLPAEELSGKNYHDMEVDWRLEPGHLYRLSVELTAPEDKGYMWVTSDENNLLPTLGNVSMGGKEKMGQMLGGVSYWRALEENSKRFLYLCTFMGIGMAAVYSCWSVSGRGKPGES